MSSSAERALPTLTDEHWRKPLAWVPVVGSVVLIVFTVLLYRGMAVRTGLGIQLIMWLPFLLGGSLPAIPALRRWLRNTPIAKRHAVRAALVGALIGPAVWWVLVTMLVGVSPRSITALALLPAVSMVLAAGALFFFAPLVRGEEGLFCSSCGYRCGWTSEAETPERCSECGYAWRGRLLVGRPARSVGLYVSAFVLMAVAVASTIYFQFTFAKVAPAWLIRAVALQSTDNFYVWRRFEQFPLTAAEQAEVMDQLIARRLTGKEWESASFFLRRMGAQPAFTPEQVDRLMDADFAFVRLEQVATAPGASATVRLWTVLDEASPFGLPIVIARHFRVDGGPLTEVIGNGGTAPGVYFFRTQLRDWPSISKRGDAVISLPGEPGSLAGKTVSVYVYYVLRAAGDFSVYTWNEQGEPVFPTPPKSVRKFTLEVKIR